MSTGKVEQQSTNGDKTPAAPPEKPKPAARDRVSGLVAVPAPAPAQLPDAVTENVQVANSEEQQKAEAEALAGADPKNDYATLISSVVYDNPFKVEPQMLSVVRGGVGRAECACGPCTDPLVCCAFLPPSAAQHAPIAAVCCALPSLLYSPRRRFTVNPALAATPSSRAPATRSRRSFMVDPNDGDECKRFVTVTNNTPERAAFKARPITV